MDYNSKIYNRILTIQDISCVGQCSLTVALPIISALSVECAILPSAVLSTHTAGFTGWTCRDLASDMPNILQHWVSENIKFNAFYTGYLGSPEQIPYVLDIFSKTSATECKIIVDPAMADNGKLYPAFNDVYVKKMLELCRNASVILPNITEACFLTGFHYKEKYDKSYVLHLIDALSEIGLNNVVLTGVGFTENTTGVFISINGNKTYLCHERINQSYHGTGDIFSSVFTALYVRGFSAHDSAKAAAYFVMESIKETIGDSNHSYGVKFEKILSEFSYKINKEGVNSIKTVYDQIF